MNLSRRIRIQLVVFTLVVLVAGTVMIVGYVRLPAMFGIGRYAVTLQLPASGGLYPAANVTYRGTKVGRVKAVDVNDDGIVEALLSLENRVSIPSNLKAEVHSQTAIGEQYVALLPRDATSPPLKTGDVITLDNASVPPPIDEVLDAANLGLQSIPRDSLKTAIDESYTAFGGLGPELSRIVKGATTLAHDARINLDSLTALVDQSAPVLNSQTESSNDIALWAASLADITAGLRERDSDLGGLIRDGGSAAGETRQLFERLQPSLPVLLANLVSVNRVAIAYQPAIQQLLVLIPQGASFAGATVVPNRFSDKPYRGSYTDFNLNLNLPPPCTTGYLPATQRRTAAQTDAPERPDGLLYCRVPQDAPQNVRGARNLPCLTRPGRRAPTVTMCENDEQYVPLNDGWNWKGDPNATLSGQDIPQTESGKPTQAEPPQAPPPPAVVPYDPSTGAYLAPDGKVYTQPDLAPDAPEKKTWESLLVPPG